MAFGGVQVNVLKGAPDRGDYLNYLKIDGLSLGALAAPPASIADPGVGELTTAVPGPFQNGIPTSFGRGRGKWQPGDENSMIVKPSVLIDANFLFAAIRFLLNNLGGLPAIRVVNGDLIITMAQQPGAGFGGIAPIEFQFIHTEFQ